MDTGSDQFGDFDFEEQVRQTAYLLWEAEGRHEGREKEYWHRALDKCMRNRREEERGRRGLLDPM